MGGDKEGRRIGRDEMNLAEFPITLLTDRAPKGVKTLAFEGRHGKLTVTGSDAYASRPPSMTRSSSPCSS